MVENQLTGYIAQVKVFGVKLQDSSTSPSILIATIVDALVICRCIYGTFVFIGDHGYVVGAASEQAEGCLRQGPCEGEQAPKVRLRVGSAEGKWDIGNVTSPNCIDICQ